MPGWTLLDNHPTRGRAFHRPLDVIERHLVWGSIADGASDCLFRVDLHLSSSAKDAQLFSDDNIVQAWLSTKRRYPLTGATLQGPPSSSASGADSTTGILAIAANPHFVVQESDLAVVRPHEIVFGHVASPEEMDRRADEIFDGPRLLSPESLARLYVLRETGKDDVLYVMVLMMHCVTDMTAYISYMRCFLDMLARGGESEPAQLPLEDRLAMSIPMAESAPIQLRSLSPARRRWRNAAARVIFQLRMEKIQGGHTLPSRLTSATPFISARSRETRVFLTPEETDVVLANCRRHKITFGNAYLALAQVAMARLLYRRYLRGDISEEEWDYRKEQPHTIAGPFSLRPYLDKTWLEKGGGGESVASVGTSFFRLPFMPLGETARRYQPDGENIGLSNGAPPFSELLTFDRFLYRAELLKKQAVSFFKHPLFLELVHASTMSILGYLQTTSLEWLERIEAAKDGQQEDTDMDEDVLAPMDIPTAIAHGGSSFGVLDSVLPLGYPLPPTNPLSPLSSVPHSSKAGYVPPSPQSPSATPKASGTDSTAPKMVLKNVQLSYHSRPGDLYLGAWSSGGRMRMYSIYDRNVYEEVVIQEWLDEIKGAVLWYLGQPHESRQAQNSRVGSLEAGQRKAGQAKL